MFPFEYNSSYLPDTDAILYIKIFQKQLSFTLYVFFTYRRYTNVTTAIVLFKDETDQNLFNHIPNFYNNDKKYKCGDD